MPKPRSYKSAIGEATVSEDTIAGKKIYFIQAEIDSPEAGLTSAQTIKHLERLNKWVDGALAWLATRAGK